VTNSDQPDNPRVAAYGLQIDGVESGGALALWGCEHWPTLRIKRSIDQTPAPDGAIVGEHRASITIPGGHIELDRDRRTATIHSARTLDEAEIVHPALWPAAAVCARWAGAETLHAGAFCLPDRPGAWLVIGESGGGKSSLLASLSLAGCPVLVDDLVVVDGGDCYAGPRCIDLKPDAPGPLGITRDVTVVRGTERRRLALAPCDGRMPLQGFVHLAWGVRTSIGRLPPSECFATLARHRRVGALGADLDQLLDLAALPMFRLQRERSWGSLAESRRSLIDALSSSE
jgi:hypothetical protein